MLHPSTQKLILKLCELTEGGDISWKEGSGQCAVFETEGYKVEVDGDPPLVRLLGADGRELEVASAADLELAWPSGEGTFASHVAEMARRAHRIARGAELAISRILSSLSAPPQMPTAIEPEPVSTAIEREPEIAATEAEDLEETPAPARDPKPAIMAAAPAAERPFPLALLPPGPAFGATSSFSRAPDASKAPVTAAEVATRQAAGAQAALSVGHKPPPAAAPASPPTAGPLEREPDKTTAPARGADIYKPWS